MLAVASTFTLDGIAARPVRVEVDVHRGLPAFSLVGLPDAAVREARERVRSALVNCGFEFPLRRITVNLAPADLRKAGPGLDLAIAQALLAATEQLPAAALGPLAVAGELALDGSVRPIAGVFAMAEEARRAGRAGLVVPAENGPEAALVDGIEVLPLERVDQLPALIGGECRPPRPRPLALSAGADGDGSDLEDLRGQPALRRGLEIAAAGGHNLLIIGPPGAGKSLAARRLPSILPPLERHEALEVARIASACGDLIGGLPIARPFRAPHHTISYAGLVGGGNPPSPGEVTRAHRGLLFLDELGEFQRPALESLRDPLEEGSVSLSRAGRALRLPCRFMLVAAANPCPCGRGEQDRDCTCPPQDLRRYERKLSGALVDRIDIRLGVAQPRAEALGGDPGEASAPVRARVAAARRRQWERLGRGRCNAEMTTAEVRSCASSAAARRLLTQHHESRGLSGRGHDRVLRLARTIADLAPAERIEEAHLGEALGLRPRILTA
jgi:magnesium chelatase family protein